MNMMFGTAVAIGVLFSSALWVRAESNDSLKALTNAEAQLQLKLDQFATNSSHYELLLDAQKISASLNPRGDNKTSLNPLDEGCLRLQLKVLLALARARDPRYDPSSPIDWPAAELVPPGTNGMKYPSGVDPKAIKEPDVRKAYEEAIAENKRRSAKLKRELALSRGEDYAVMDIWIFVKRGLPENSTARKRAFEIIQKTVSDESVLKRLKSDSMPGLTR